MAKTSIDWKIQIFFLASKRRNHRSFWSILALSLSLSVVTSQQAQTKELNLISQNPLVLENFPSQLFPKKSKRVFNANKNKDFLKIQKINVLGSTAFSQEELEAATASFIGKEANLENSLAIRSTIAQLYVDNGYTTSGAFLPNEQDISDGIIEIQVIEGEIEEIEIKGLSHLNESYVRSRIERAAKPPLNVNKLQTALQLLLNDPLIETLRANLAVGTSQGLSRLEIKISEADAFSIGVGYDNRRSPSVGSERRFVELGSQNLLGFGDRANFSYINTDGSDTFSFSYEVPINASNATIGLAYATSSNEIIEEPFTPLDIQSEIDYYELTFRQPLIQNPNEEFAVGITGNHIESESSLLGTGFPLSKGADEQGRTQISALRFFSEYTTRNEREVFNLRSQVSWGNGAFEATTKGEPDSEFLAWRLQSSYVRQLAPETLFLLRGQLQLANQELLADEQFRLGGFDTVRGYRQDVLLGDNGVFASAEVRLPIVRIPEWETFLQVVPFFDVGKVWNDEGDNSDPSTLVSLGLGLLLSGSENVSAGIYYGIPLIELEEQGDSLQEEGISFFVEGRVSF